MSLTDCTACKKAISKNAAACPHCGEPVPKPRGFFSLLLIAVLILISASLLMPKDRPSDRASAVQPTTSPTPSPFASAPWMEPFDHKVLTKEQTRSLLKDKYLALYEVLNPSYNHMKTAIRRHEKGYALWVEHPFFNKYEYQIGSNSLAVQTFISQHQAALIYSNIVIVGARDNENDVWTGYQVK